MRKIYMLICFSLLFAAVFAATSSSIALAQSEINVVVDGARLDLLDRQPVIVNGRTLVPVRGVFQSLGFTVKWEQTTLTATLTSDANTVVIKEGDSFFLTNGTKYELDVPAQVINDRMMLPFRALIESVGYFAYWDADSVSVMVFTNGPAEGFGDTDGPGVPESVPDGTPDGIPESVPDDTPPPEQPRQTGTLPPPGGRRVVQGQPFGVDLHYNPNVIFHGSFYVHATSVARYIEVLSTFREKVPETVRVFCILAPTSVEFLPEKYSANVAGQRGPIELINSRLSAAGVIAVDAYSFLEQHASNEYLYFRTDFHWTALGGYYAYLAFAQAAEFDPITVYDYIEFGIPNFIGLHISGTPSSAVQNSPDTLYYFKLDNGTTFSQNLFVVPKVISRTGYRVFLGGDLAPYEFTSSNKNGRTLIVIKDSYANAFIPWAAPHYEKIVVIDPRHSSGSINKYLDNSADTDVVFLTSANTPSYPDFVERMAKIVK